MSLQVPIFIEPDGGGGTGGGGNSPVFITTSQLSIGNVGAQYGEYLDAVDGYLPYVWSLTSGQLPAGLTLSSSGLISGICSVAGNFTFTVRVTDNINGIYTKSLSIQVDGSSSPVITTSSLPSLLVGQNYTQTLQATGGTTPYTNWEIIVGNLPSGVTLNSSTGVISGSPNTAGTYSFTVEVTDSNDLTDIQSLSIIVQALSPTITTTGLPDAVAGINYSATVNAIGGTTPYVNWDIITGQLPQGLVITTNPTNAIIMGTPTLVGSYTFTVKLTDSSGGVDNQVLNIIVYDGAYPIVSTINLNDGQIGIDYNQSLMGAGGSLPYKWSVQSGTLPLGLELDESTGIISGTPTANGSYIFTVKLIDNNLNEDTQILSITIGSYTLPSIITKSLLNGIVGSTYYNYVQALGGDLPYTWSILTPLPTGLSLNSSTGLISETPTTAGNFSVKILVQDRYGKLDIKTFPITIGLAVNPLIVTTSIPDAEKSIVYNQTLSVAGGTPSYTWTVTSGGLPSGMSLSKTGVISGTPNVIGLYNFTVTVVDSASKIDTQNYSLLIKSSGYNSRCCICVFTGDVVNFFHNSTNGVLTSSGGTILNNTQWQAPSISGFYDITISVEGINGIITAKNTVNVVERLRLVDSNSFINNLLPGDSFYIKTNYPPDRVEWTTLDCEIPIVTPNGHVYVQTNPADKCFGALDCTIRASLKDIENCSITSTVDVKIKVNPIYPTPDNCGPRINKWVRESKDFRVISTEFEGGCAETHIRNKVPIVRWSVTYTGLKNYLETKTTCPNCSNISINSECYHITTLPSSVSDCMPELQSSNRLDDFWNIVFGEYGSFTLIDYDTQEVWYNVKFADKMTNDHIHRRTATSRTSNLIWRPCCNKSPAGGTCSKHGMLNYKPRQQYSNKVSCNLIDNIILKVINVFATAVSLEWTVSSINPISGYQIRMSGDIYNEFVIDVGNVKDYVYTHLKNNTDYIFEVRAYDENHHYSSWSSVVSAKTLLEETNDEDCLIDQDGNVIFDEDGNCLTDDELIYYLTDGDGNFIIDNDGNTIID